MTKKPTDWNNPTTGNIDVAFKVFGEAGGGKTNLVELVLKPAIEAAGLKLKQVDEDGHVFTVYGTLK